MQGAQRVDHMAHEGRLIAFTTVRNRRQERLLVATPDVPPQIEAPGAAVTGLIAKRLERNCQLGFPAALGQLRAHAEPLSVALLMRQHTFARGGCRPQCTRRDGDRDGVAWPSVVASPMAASQTMPTVTSSDQPFFRSNSRMNCTSAVTPSSGNAL